MDFISNKEPQQILMLQAIGVNSIDELFADIPKELRLARPEKEDGMSELEGMRFMETLGRKNTFPEMDCYLGAGAYEHHIPALVSSITQRGEFLTSYTPYQAEASQGMLQVIFEFQSAICALTGMDVANASVYDGASACAEACLMAIRQTKRNKIVISETLNPHYRKVVELYLKNLGLEIVVAPPTKDGLIDFHHLDRILDTKTAALLIQSPNFLGVIDRVSEVSPMSQAVGALTIVCANPMAYGLFQSAAEIGADIAVGDCQPFGLPLNFGGPYVGYMACKKDLVRQLPGRIVGETVDTTGRRGFVLTLQAREQHIRREKATSNICTNQSLAAMASLIAMLWYGREGIPKLALTNYQRADYLRENLQKIEGVETLEGATHFNEFVVRFPVPLDGLFHHLRTRSIEPGIDLGRYDSKWKDHLLVAVTETKSKEHLDHYLTVAQEVAKWRHE